MSIVYIDEAIDETLDIWACTKCNAEFACWIKIQGEEIPVKERLAGYKEPTKFITPKFCPNCGIQSKF